MKSREAGLKWLQTKGRRTDERIKVSKYYLPEESFPGVPVWWFEFPASLPTSDPFSFLNLLCAVAPDSSEYHHLRVPMGLFLACKHHLALRRNDETVSLYLSAEEPTLFHEVRWTGRIDFGVFKVD